MKERLPSFPNLVVTKCPKGCENCAREYSSNLITGHKLICICQCHTTKEKEEVLQAQ
jgi:hypothetical protein